MYLMKVAESYGKWKNLMILVLLILINTLIGGIMSSQS